jgi:gliding motility-associated-like protein
LNQADSFQNIQSSATLVDCLIDSTGSLAVSLNGGVPGYSFLWSDGQQGSTAVGLTAGVYTVTITDANNCTLLITDTVNASFQPQVAAFVGQNPIIDTTINWGDLITLDVGNDQSADSVSYLWEQLSNISGLNLDNPTATQTTVMPEPDSNEVYTILLTATSADGCQDTATVQIRVNIETLLGMPDAFTPNGDGFNDYFRPAGLDDQFILEFKIYNRWGQVVFDGTDTSSSWDGTYRGVEQPTEVYIYLLHYQLPGQIPMVMKGEMTLIR